MADESAPKRGRPRSETARRKILAAARSLLEERGLAGVTMEAIATRAEVGKPTIYRYWPNAHAVAMDAFLETAEPTPGPKRKEMALQTLRRHLRAIAGAFASPAGRSTAAMIAAAQNDSELAKVFRNRFIMQSRERGRTLLETAAAEGDVDGKADFQTALDMIYAPLYFRLLIGHGRLDSAFTDGLLDLVLTGLRRR
ncbi:MAG TPA: TetR/AcrR family transcriptional regulator [Rhizomicrobium sp.]|nr:TetR/AcrR family transcriptional regulator [Rhizomicrobium sp.]